MFSVSLLTGCGVDNSLVISLAVWSLTCLNSLVEAAPISLSINQFVNQLSSDKGGLVGSVGSSRVRGRRRLYYSYLSQRCLHSVAVNR